ncbi:hypothetical protein CRYUN_Cryun33cG0019600 [Craigia yunnanensis]
MDEIWKIRCEMVMEKKCVGIDEPILRINGAVNEFYRLRSDICLERRVNENSIDKNMERWLKPVVGWLKVNCDGAMDLKTKVAASGVIVRDCEGVVVDGTNRRRMVDSALMAETMALKDGIDLVIEKKW